MRVSKCSKCSKCFISQLLVLLQGGGLPPDKNPTQVCAFGAFRALSMKENLSHRITSVYVGIHITNPSCPLVATDSLIKTDDLTCTDIQDKAGTSIWTPLAVRKTTRRASVNIDIVEEIRFIYWKPVSVKFSYFVDGKSSLLLCCLLSLSRDNEIFIVLLIPLTLFQGVGVIISCQSHCIPTFC